MSQQLLEDDENQGSMDEASDRSVVSQTAKTLRETEKNIRDRFWRPASRSKTSIGIPLAVAGAVHDRYEQSDGTTSVEDLANVPGKRIVSLLERRAGQRLRRQSQEGHQDGPQVSSKLKHS